jgi:hypothetical protein
MASSNVSGMRFEGGMGPWSARWDKSERDRVRDILLKKKLGLLLSDIDFDSLALVIFTALSGWRSCGVVITKLSDHVVTFRSSPTVFADTPVPTSASTRILAGKPPR